LIKGIAFDLDGTIYLGEKLIEGADDVISFMRERNTKICFFTNGSTRTRNQVTDKLKRMGVPIYKNDEILTSSYATAVYAAEKGIRKCYCIGAEGLLKELKEQGIEITDGSSETSSVQAIIVGLDPDFNYGKLETALNIYSTNKCRIIACNLDKSYPVENSRLKPGTGSIAAAVACSANGGIEDVGKPNTYMLKMLSRKWNFKPDEILVVGDSPESDIEMAVSFGSPSILISGKDAGNYTKSVRLANIREIMALYRNH
jgi:HAD superfamily hydrolase (TIGR01450 family)